MYMCIGIYAYSPFLSDKELPKERDQHQPSKRLLALQTQIFIATMGISKLPGAVTRAAAGCVKC